MSVRISNHALLRYIERVEGVSLREARRRIMECEKSILAAAKIGCSRVVMACRSTLILDGTTVVTVCPVERKRSARVGSARNRGMRAEDNGKGRRRWSAKREQEEW